jgi:hypothetical protein
MDNYIRSGWCSSLYEEPEHLPKARKMLLKGVTDIELIKSIKSMPKEGLCKVLQETTCHVGSVDDAKCSDEIPSKQRIAIRCGGQLKCWDVLELETKIKTDKMFAASMSDFQKRKVKRRANAVRDRAMPCHAMSGNKEACEEDSNRCTYHTRSMVGSLMSEATRRHADKECHMKHTYLKAASGTCRKIDQHTLFAMVDDILYDQITSDMLNIGTEMTLLEKHMFALDVEQLLDSMKLLVRKMNRYELCAIVEEEASSTIASEWTFETVGKFSAALTTALQLKDRYISVGVLSKLAENLKLTVSIVMLEGLAVVINFAMFIYENLFVSWSAWLVLWPAGREYIKKALRDPTFAFFFFLSFKFCGLEDPLIPTIEKFSVSLGNPHFNVIFEQAGKILTQQTSRVINRENFEHVLNRIAKELRSTQRSKLVKKKVQQQQRASTRATTRTTTTRHH